MVIARGVMKRLNTWVRDVVSLWFDAAVSELRDGLF